MNKKQQITYKLIEADYPIIYNKELIRNSVNTIGEKLTYLKRTRLVYVLNILNTNIIIPTLNGNKIEKVSFLRPYKEKYGSKENIKNNYWGAKDHPLTNMWFKLGKNFCDVKSLFDYEEQIVDHNFIRHFKKRTKKFNLLINLN